MAELVLHLIHGAIGGAIHAPVLHPCAHASTACTRPPDGGVVDPRGDGHAAQRAGAPRDAGRAERGSGRLAPRRRRAVAGDDAGARRDRETESWWQQATGQGLVGAFVGDTLRMLDAQVVSWEEFRRALPKGEVLSRETGYDRPYGRNPYTGYDAPGGSPLAGFFGGRADDRLPPMERVVAVHHDGETAAYPFSRLRGAAVANDVVGSTPIVVFWAPGTASALDRAEVAEGRDVGATGVFGRRVDGRTLTFEPRAPGRFRDRETGTEWSLLGQGISGPLRGRRQQRLPAGDYFWFAWAVFRPEARIWIWR